MEPRVRVVQESVKRGAAPDRWLVGWRVQNLGAGPLAVLAARLPHGKFHSEEKLFEPAIDIAPNESRSVEMEARASAAPGSVVENAFVILRVQSAGAPWLVLARLSVHAGAEGTPNTVTESITAQPVGFSRFGMMGL